MTLRHMAGWRKLVLLTLIVIPAYSSIAWADDQGEWNHDIARQLAAEGWEYVSQQEFPLVLYGVQVVELDNEIAAYAELALGAETTDDGHSNWAISASERLLQVVSQHLEMRLQGRDDQDISYLNNVTWLGTVLGKPVSIASRQEAPTNGGSRSHFELTITPRQLEPVTQRIQTDIELEYEAQDGSTANVVLTASAGVDEPCPIALVSFSQTEKSITLNKHFALLLWAVVVPIDDYPPEVPLMKMGNLHALSTLVDQMLTQSSGSRDITHLVALGISTNGEGVGYSAQYRGLIEEGLGVAVLVQGDPTDSGPTVSLGAVDQVEVCDSLVMRAYLLPFVWDIAHSEFRRELQGGLEADLTRGKWSLSLGTQYLGNSWRFSTAVRYRVYEKAAFEIGASVKGSRYLMSTALSIEL